MSKAIRRLFIDIHGDASGAVKAAGEAESATDAAADSMKRADKESKQLRKRLKGLKSGFEILAKATGAVGIAMVSIAAASGRVDKRLAEVQATSGATAHQMDMIRSKAQELGAQLPVTMLDVSNAFREMTYAGLEAEEAIAAANAATRLAVTGGLQMAEAARATTSTLNAFRMEATQATTVANSLAATFASSAVTISEITKSLEYAASAANLAGQSVTDTTSAIGLLGDVGLRASKAGTGLQQMFARLADPSKQAKEALDKLGLSMQDFVDREGDFKNLNEIIRTLHNSVQGLSNAEKMKALTSIFRARGARAVAPLVNNVDKLDKKLSQIAASNIKGAIESLDELNEKALETRNKQISFTITPKMNQRDLMEQFVNMSENMSRSELTTEIKGSLQVDQRTAEILAGDIIDDGASVDQLVAGLNSATTASELASAKMDTVAGKVEYLRGSISSFAYTAYQSFRGPVSGALDILTDFADAMNKNESTARAFGYALMGLFGVLATATMLVGAMAAEMWWVSATTGTAASSTYGYAAAQWVLTASTNALATAHFLMTASLSTIITQLRVSRTAQLLSAASSWTLSGAVTTLAGAIGTATGALWGFLTALGPIGWIVLGVSAAFIAWKTGLLDWIGVADEFESVLNGITWTLGWLLDGVKLLGEGFVLLGKLGIAAFFATVSWAVGGLMDMVGGLVGWFDSLNTTGKLVIGALFPILGIVWGLSEALDMAQSGWNDFTGSLDSFMNVAAALLGYEIGQTAREMGEAYQFGASLINDGAQMVDSAVSGTQETLEGIGDWIREFFVKLENAPKETLSGLGSSLANSLLLPAPLALLFGVSDMGSLGQQWGQDLKGGIMDGIGTAASLAAFPITAGIGLGEDAYNMGADFATSLIDGIVNGIASTDNRLAMAIDNALAGVLPFLPSSNAEKGPLSDLTSRGQALIETIAKGVRSAKDILPKSVDVALNLLSPDVPSLGSVGNVVGDLTGGGLSSSLLKTLQPAMGPKGLAPLVSSPAAVGGGRGGTTNRSLTVKQEVNNKFEGVSDPREAARQANSAPSDDNGLLSTVERALHQGRDDYF